MTTAYELRNNEGVLVARISARLMPHATKSGGFWREFRRNTKPTTVCYEYTDDMKLDFDSVGVPMTVFMWAGYTLIAVD